MEVLLLKAVSSLGRAGQVVKVADGYAHNYLFPKGLARPATEGALKRVRAEEATKARQQEVEGKRLEELAQRIHGLEVHITGRSGGGEKLYGSITSQDIAEALEKVLGEPVDRRKVELEEPIRELGTYRVAIRLGGDLAPYIKVVVEAEEGQGA